MCLGAFANRLNELIAEAEMVVFEGAQSEQKNVAYDATARISQVRNIG